MKSRAQDGIVGGIVGRRVGSLGRGHIALLSGLLASACGSSGNGPAGSSAAGTQTPRDGGLTDARASTGLGGASDGGASTGLGAVCTESQACASRVCLRFTSNAQDVPGICSALCSGAAGCGGAAACIAVAALDGGACYPTCSAAAGCAGGLPCIWDTALDAGLCQPLPTSFCADIAAQGACERCLGASCCNQVTACAEDVACNQLQSSCPGNAACASALQSSANKAAQGLGSCAASSCARACQGSDAAAP